MPEYTLTGPSGTELFVRVWEPTGGPRSLVFIAHGFGEHSGRYEHVAARLTARGHLVVALDHMGHGKSGGTRGRVAFDPVVADLDAVVDSQVEVHPGLKRFLIGHSFGGAVALRYALAHQDRLTGLILSGPVTVTDGVNPVTKVIGQVLARVAPNLPVINLPPESVSRDPAVVQAYKDDPLVRHKGIPAASGAAMVAHADTIFADAGEITIPTLLLWGTEDKLCPASGSEQLARSLGATDLETGAFPGLYHEIFNEPEQDTVLDRVVTWLGTRS